jgi:hypothetical protein
VKPVLGNTETLVVMKENDQPVPKDQKNPPTNEEKGIPRFQTFWNLQGF